jgi:hypothetical protein
LSDEFKEKRQVPVSEGGKRLDVDAGEKPCLPAAFEVAST